MTCDEVREQLDAFLAGGLDPAVSDGVATHLAGCAECRADLEAARLLAPQVASLPRSVSPDRDLWAGIEPRLRRRRGGDRVAVPVWALIAAAILLVAGTSVITRRLGSGAEAVALLPASFVDAENRYLAAASDLAAAYAAVRDRLPPETRQVVERNLAAIERALAETRRALERDPANQSLESLVLSTYRQKLDFLEQASALEGET